MAVNMSAQLQNSFMTLRTLKIDSPFCSISAISFDPEIENSLSGRLVLLEEVITEHL